eukprot:CAMPEP_0178372612 /NCGR_PEP_ID=MMETSP0689_2-20121128/1443_1 /TAXON_ID=160604 /ORGANISM="Amphidinium massartii, Strain CS-259" /LENGTH=111 /DNA_ID=CAMNT_0019992541 /DNA_START=1110 /DNA_END=1445 /DNA_ORIENTATION=+
MTWAITDRPLSMGTRSHPIGDIRQQHLKPRAELMCGDDSNRMPPLRSSQLHFVQVHGRPRRSRPCHHHTAANLLTCNELNRARPILGACGIGSDFLPVAMQDESAEGGQRH